MLAEPLNHHETHVALDAAQGCPHLKKGRKTGDNNGEHEEPL
jgi:hypothetical protein